MADPTVYEPVKRGGTELGSLTLDGKQLTFQPKNADASASAVIHWKTVTKQQANPVKHTKALIKIVTTGGKPMTFQLKNRVILDKLVLDISQRLEECNSNNNNGSSEGAESDSNEAPTTYSNIRFQSVAGTVTLSAEKLVYQPDEDNDDNSKGKRKALTIHYSKVAKHQASPPKVAKAMLKFVLSTKKNMTFQLTDRKELKSFHQDVTRRLKRYQATSTTNPRAAASVKGEDSSSQEEANEKRAADPDISEASEASTASDKEDVKESSESAEEEGTAVKDERDEEKSKSQMVVEEGSNLPENKESDPPEEDAAEEERKLPEPDTAEHSEGNTTENGDIPDTAAEESQQGFDSTTTAEPAEAAVENASQAEAIEDSSDIESDNGTTESLTLVDGTVEAATSEQEVEHSDKATPTSTEDNNDDKNDDSEMEEDSELSDRQDDEALVESNESTIESAAEYVDENSCESIEGSSSNNADSMDEDDAVEIQEPVETEKPAIPGGSDNVAQVDYLEESGGDDEPIPARGEALDEGAESDEREDIEDNDDRQRCIDAEGNSSGDEKGTDDHNDSFALSEASDINEDDWVEGDPSGSPEAAQAREIPPQNNSSMDMASLMDADNSHSSSSGDGSSREDLNITEEVVPSEELEEYEPRRRVYKTDQMPVMPTLSYKSDEKPVMPRLSEDDMDEYDDVEYGDDGDGNDYEDNDKDDVDDYEAEEYEDDPQISSLLGGNVGFGEDDDSVEDFDVFGGKPIREKVANSDKVGHQSEDAYSDEEGRQSNDGYESDGGWSDEDEHREKQHRHKHQHDHGYDSDDDPPSSMVADDEEMAFFDDDSPDELGGESAISILQGSSLPLALLEGTRGRERRGGGAESVSTQSSEDTMSLSGITGVGSLASAVSNSSSDGEGGNRSDASCHSSHSDSTASFEDGSDYTNSDSGDGSSSEGSGSSSEAESDDESDDASEEAMEEAEYYDPVSAWLTYSETGDDTVFPEAKVKIAKLKKKRRKAARDQAESEEEYSSERGDVFYDEEESEGEEMEEGDMNRSMNLEEMTVDDLESALVKKLKSEIGGADSGTAEEAVNRMLASIKDDLLGDHATSSRRKSSHRGMPEDFYDWAKRAATRVMSKESSDGVPGDSEESNVSEPPSGMDAETRFNWKKYAKQNVEQNPENDNNADEPPSPSVEAERAPTTSESTTEESPIEETPAEEAAEALQETPPEESAEEPTEALPELSPQASPEALVSQESAPEEDRDDAENETNAVDPATPERDSSVEVAPPGAKDAGDQEGSPELKPFDDDLVERWTIRPSQDDPEARVFNWKGFTRSRSTSTGSPETPSFDWKKHAKEQRKQTKKNMKEGSTSEGAEAEPVLNDDNKSGEVSTGQQPVPPPPPPTAGVYPIDNGVDLLKKLITSTDDSTRGAILKQYLGPPPSPEDTKGHVSPEDLLKAITKFVETIRSIKQSDNAPEITSARQVAILARLAIIHHYGDGSETLKTFERGLAPAFAPKAAAAAVAVAAAPAES